MDTDLHTRIEELEGLAKQTLAAVNKLQQSVDSLTAEFTTFRREVQQLQAEQRQQGARFEAGLKQVGARVGAVEGRVSAVEARLSAVEEIVQSDGS